MVALVCTAMHASMPASLSALSHERNGACVRAPEDTYETGHGSS
jgi:hypothetical protein